jgi:hypothetical protein
MNNLKFARGDFQLRQCHIAQQLALRSALNIGVAALSSILH